MNALESLTQQIEQLRVRYGKQWRSLRKPKRWRKIFGRANISGYGVPALMQSLKSFLPLGGREREGAEPGFRQTLPSRQSYRAHTPGALVLAVVCLTGAMGHRFYNKPKLDVGTVAPYTIVAPESVMVEDTKTTAENRKAARTGSVPVLAIDPAVNQQIYKNLRRSLAAGSELRQMAGQVPLTSESILSLPVQLYLRKAREADWLAVQAAVKDKQQTASGSSHSTPSAAKAALQKSLEALRLIARTDGVRGAIKHIRPSLSAAGLQAVTELHAYRQTASPEDFSALLQTVNRARQRYFQAVAALSELPALGPLKAYDTSLFDLSEAAWQEMQQNIYQAADRILVQGIPAGLPEGILKDAVSVQVKAGASSEADTLARKLLLSVLQPNLREDPEQTRRKAEQVAQAVPSVFVTIEKGEVIVLAGQEIAQADFVLLDYFGKSQREPNWLGLAGFSGVVSLAVGALWLVERRFHPGLRRRDQILLLLLTLSAPLLAALRVPSTSLPAIGLLAGSFYGSAVGATVVGLLAWVLPVGLEIDAISLLACAASAAVGGLISGRLRSREELALLGVAVGLTQGGVYLISTLIVNPSAGLVWYALLSTAALQSLAGLAWSVVALGLSPYLEKFFDLVPPIRLAELANPNRPLLKRLAAEAPGTFQHTLFVATLAEAAARELGCNVELVRTGTLYHDIGKMHDPLGFIENQMGGPNKHDEIDDPWKSAAIIKKHVSEGLVMARKYRLPAAIQAFIPEHQGTMQIAYFYHQALQLAKENPSLTVREEDFRYDGPIPQSRETGIVMLADSCEAALRSLKDATPEEALNMVNKILRARWQDNQLADSGLTREEMSKIAEIFVRVWQQFNHKRIAYPKAALCPQPAKV
jgi:putative nucleotidyltransferase with HDIG domain